MVWLRGVNGVLACAQRARNSTRLLHTAPMHSTVFSHVRCCSATAADAFVNAWISRQWITDAAQYPAAPSSVAEVYETHTKIEEHTLTLALGGVGGYKVGAPNAEGEIVWYAPLFSNYIVHNSSDTQVGFSVSSINAHQVEPEFVVVLSHDLPAKPDLSAHSVGDVWAAIDHIRLAIEVCGSRATQAVKNVQPRLAAFADSLNAGGLVLGKRLQKETLSPADMARAPASLLRNDAVIAHGGGGKVFPGQDTGPIDALAFVANSLNQRGLLLRKGMVVATGQTCMTREFAVGDSIIAKFGEAGALGSVKMRLEP